MPAPRPSAYLNWIPTDNPAFIQTPSGGQLTTGWVAGEMPPFQYANWVTNLEDHWIQYLDQALTAILTNGASLTADPTVLVTTGDVAIGSNVVSNLASLVGVGVGTGIAATGLPANSYVTRVVSGSSVEVSQRGTSNQVATSVTFSHTYATGTTIQAQLNELDQGTAQDLTRRVFSVAGGSSAVVLSNSSDPTASHRGVIFDVQTSSGAQNFQLPEPSRGFHFFIKDIGGHATNLITLLRFSAESIEGTAGNLTLSGAQFSEWEIYSDGANWFVAAQVSPRGNVRAAAVNATSVSATGAVSAASVSATGAVSAASVSATGAVSAASVSATGAVSAASVSATGVVHGDSVTATTSVSGASVSATGVVHGDSVTATTTVAAGSTVTGGTGVIATVGDVHAIHGNVIASEVGGTGGAISADRGISSGTSIVAATTVTGDTGVIATTGDVEAMAGSVKASNFTWGMTTAAAGSSGSGIKWERFTGSIAGTSDSGNLLPAGAATVFGMVGMDTDSLVPVQYQAGAFLYFRSNAAINSFKVYNGSSGTLHYAVIVFYI